MSDIRNWKKIVENATKVVENDAEDVNHTDHEVSMAKSQLLSSVKSSVRIAKHLKDLSEDKGLEGWVASKITLAEEYLQTVADYMDGQEINESVVSEAGGYYTQPVYDMIEKHGIQKVMHELLTSLDADVIQDFISRAEFTESEKRWKQTSMSPEQAEKEYGKENVKVKRGGLRNGDDMVQVFVEDKAKGVRGALSKLPHIGRHIHGHDHKPTQPPSLKGMKIVPNDIPNQPSPQDDPPQSKNPSQPTPSPHMDPPQPKQPSEPKQDRQPKQPERPRQKQPRKAIYASKLKEKIFQAAKENEQQINELDLYAPNTDYIRAPNGEYFKVEYRNTGTITGGGRKAGDLTSFKSVVKADPKEVDVLDLEGRLNYADTDGSGVKSKKSNTIHTGHDHQGGGPLGGKDISVYDMDSEEYHDNVPDGVKGAVIKYMTAQQDESARSERRLRIADWIQTRKQ